MFAWVYEVLIAPEGKPKILCKLGFRWAEVLAFESFKSDPEGVLHVTLSSGRQAVIMTSQKDFIEHMHENKPLLYS